MSTLADRTTAQHLVDCFDAGVGSIGQLAILMTVRDITENGGTCTRVDLIDTLSPMDRNLVVKAVEALTDRGLIVRLPMKRDVFWCRFRYVLSELAERVIEPLI